MGADEVRKKDDAPSSDDYEYDGNKLFITFDEG